MGAFDFCTIFLKLLRTLLSRFEGCLTVHLHHEVKWNANLMQQCNLLKFLWLSMFRAIISPILRRTRLWYNAPTMLPARQRHFNKLHCCIKLAFHFISLYFTIIILRMFAPKVLPHFASALRLTLWMTAASAWRSSDFYKHFWSRTGTVTILPFMAFK